MSDQYPTHLATEIDRPRLKTYLRVQWLLTWSLLLPMFGGLLGVVSLAKTIDRGKHVVTSFAQLVAIGSRDVAMGIGCGVLLSIVLYYFLCHRRAARYAQSLEVSVEGPFLRIREHSTVRSDLKVHFRSIVDYTVMQSFLMRRFGIQSLLIRTTASHVTVLGVKDCLRIRDVLSDIDRIRDNQ